MATNKLDQQNEDTYLRGREKVRNISEKFEGIAKARPKSVTTEIEAEQDGVTHTSGNTVDTKEKQSLVKGKSTQEDWVCTTCLTIFSDDFAKVLECENCHEHTCARCLKLTNSQYATTKRDDLLWLCSNECRIEVQNLIKMKQLIEGMNLMVNKLDKLECSVKKIESTLEENLRSDKAMSLDLGNLVTGIDRQINTDNTDNKHVDDGSDLGTERKNALASNDNTGGPWNLHKRTHANPNTLRAIMKEAMVEQKKEDELQAQRKNNLIIFRSQESEEKDNKKRKQHDNDFFEELCNEVLEIGSIEVIETTRLGKPNEINKRPLRIKLKNTTDKIIVTESLNKLKYAEGKFKEISVSEDISKKEREEIKIIAQEAKNWLRENGSEIWKFRVRGTEGQHWVQWIKKRPAPNAIS